MIIKGRPISSADNPEIKHAKKLLDDKKYRYEQGEYVIEGFNALDNLDKPVRLYVLEGTNLPSVICDKVFILTDKIFKTISSTENSQGIVVTAPLKLLKSKDIYRNERYVLLDKVQDPGNVGTIIRSACAFGYKGVIFTPGTVDPFSPKVVRSAASALNLVDMIKIDDFPQLGGFHIITADMKGKDISKFSWPASFILALGNEGAGISEELAKIAKGSVAIPMSGKIESLNVAVSAAILMYSSR
jgi:RNA methyltransferase, TrmH family